MNDSSESQLAPPGAGLPTAELMVARLLFAWRRWTGNPRSFDARFQRERETIRTLLRDLEPERGSRRILIRRVPGLEDSSRNWSVWMTLDHLRIVHVEMARVIDSLVRGTVPEGAASTAAVKPSAEASASILAAYEASCDALLQIAGSATNLCTRLRFPHPWFGPMNAADWFALAAAGHLGIHRIQIERILAGLRVPPHGQE